MLGGLSAWLFPHCSADDQDRTAMSAGEGFSLLEQGGEPFEGFRWRTSDDLKVNFFWLLHYVTENTARQNRVANPNPVNRVWFDDIVVANSYIGPIRPE